MTIADRARPEIRSLSPYAAATQVRDTVRLNANEAAWTHGADRFRRPLNRYPEIRPARLGAMLAERFGCPASQLLVTRGTSEAIDLLIRVFCRAGEDSIVIMPPTFSMYAHYAAIQNAGVIEVPTYRDRDFAVDANAVLGACDPNTRVVFVCSPNNPTGTSTPAETVVALLEQLRDKAAVVVDEAYIEYSSNASLMPLLDDFDNLVVLRTLSKALAFAGARCGAVAGSAEVVAMLDAVQAPYAMATPVVECVEAALEDQWLTDAGQHVAGVVAERQRLVAALRELPVVTRIWPSDANFVLVAVRDADAVMGAARAAGVLLRYFGRTLSDCVRITVGTPAENDLLLEALAGVRA